MNAIQQKCRPKHQVLVLKCYPRTTKGAVDVKPNSSELSYLLFYATSRRSKIQKIGAFLEKKTASDVWRMRIGNVQVTLGILTALVDKAPKDVSLIAPCILKILDLILRSNDITMTESSLTTFEAFCEHHDPSSLFADQTYLHQYESIIRAYAELASPKYSPPKGSGSVSRPLQVRWRTVGLDAIKCVAASESLSSVAGRQLDVIAPIILDNLWTDNDDFLEMLVHRVQTEEKVDADRTLRRRTSVATVDTSGTGGDINPLALSGTAVDVDKMADEDIGVLAMQCLKSIFVAPNRSQIYVATNALLKFLSEKIARGETVVSRVEGTNRDAGWAIRMFNIITRWAPVQDRYVILVVAMDALMRTPMNEDKQLRQHTALVAMIGSLLRSDINLIGLSVMDVLLGFVKQMRRLINLSDDGETVENGTDEKIELSEKSVESRPRRLDLLERVEQCIGDLANHIYYADQISDMIAAIVARLKPMRSSSMTSTPQAEKNEENGDANPISSLPDLGQSQSHSDVYFSHNVGRIAALRVIRAILLVANPKSKVRGNMDLPRNRVPLHVWEGTQWLLRDPDGRVRQAYVETLITWLDRETTPADAAAGGDGGRPSLKNSRELPSARRAVSNASQRERQPRGRRSQFLPLLHLAIYDNALQFVEYDNDLVLLHGILTKLVFKLGANSARFGIPMIYRLQEDIQDLDQPIHKVRVASLCHGYFWALLEKFDFETSVVGRAILNEVVRRRNKGFWVDGINVPAPPVQHMGVPGEIRPHPNWDLSALATEELLPFDDRSSLVDCIATGYEEYSLSPPGSPVASSVRRLSNNMMNSSLGSGAGPDKFSEFPESCREEMMTDWSRDSVVAALNSESKAESLNGSRSGTTGTNRNRLTIHTVGLNGANGSHHQPGSPYGSLHNLRPHSSQAYGERDRDRIASISKLRKSSVRSGISPSPSMSSKAGVASVEQLKMVLSGNVSPKTAGLPGVEDDSGDSMVSYEYSPSEASFNPPGSTTERPGTTGEASQRAAFGPRLNPANANALDGLPVGQSGSGNDAEDDIPPVPPLPNLSSFTGKGDLATEGTAFQDHTAKASGRSREESGRSMDLQELLRGIDSRSGEGSLGNLTKPPY